MDGWIDIFFYTSTLKVLNTWQLLQLPLPSLTTSLNHTCFFKKTKKIQAYIQLLNRADFTLLWDFWSSWTFILWVVHQLSLYDPLDGFNTSQRQRNESETRTHTQKKITQQLKIRMRMLRWKVRVEENNGKWKTDRRWSKRSGKSSIAQKNFFKVRILLKW